MEIFNQLKHGCEKVRSLRKIKPNKKKYEEFIKKLREGNKKQMNEYDSAKDLDDFFQKTAENIYKIYGQYWEERDKNTKHLISYSSIILATTITFWETIIQYESSTIHFFFLGLSWLGFIIVILLSVATIWITLGLKEVRRKFYLKWYDIIEHVTDKKEETDDEFVGRVVSEIADSLFKRDGWAKLLVNLSYVVFFIAVILLILFGCDYLVS